MSELYNRIGQLCETRGITITEMCRLSGASRGSLTDLKKDRINTLKAETLKKIADLFEVSIDYLITGEFSETEKSPRPVCGRSKKLRRLPEFRSIESG